jgi:hypothetical protein
MTRKAEINQYLALEFGVEDTASDAQPFVLTELATLPSGTHVFEFSDGETDYFVLDGASLGYLPKEGLEIQELADQEAGAAWVSSQDPVDLDTSRLGDPNVPSVLERRRVLRELAAQVTTQPELLEGLFLCKTRQYVALLQDSSTRRRFVVGSELPPIECPARKLSPWRVVDPTRASLRRTPRRLTLGCSRRGPLRSCPPSCAIMASRATRLNPGPLAARWRGVTLRVVIGVED